MFFKFFCSDSAYLIDLDVNSLQILVQTRCSTANRITRTQKYLSLYFRYSPCKNKIQIQVVNANEMYITFYVPVLVRRAVSTKLYKHWNELHVPGAHPPSYPMGTRSSFPTGKAAVS
jgi:hypothetical protein